jgi:hypothetical protein
VLARAEVRQVELSRPGNLADSINQGCQVAIESFHQRHDNVMSKMEVLKTKVDLLTTQVTTLEGLLQQVLQE